MATLHFINCFWLFSRHFEKQRKIYTMTLNEEMSLSQTLSTWYNFIIKVAFCSTQFLFFNVMALFLLSSCTISVLSVLLGVSKPHLKEFMAILSVSISLWMCFKVNCFFSYGVCYHVPACNAVRKFAVATVELGKETCLHTAPKCEIQNYR